MSLESSEQYIIRSKIGQGGMGVVYLAEDTSLERPVAIKELTRPAVPGQDATESRFQQEALALARLNHPNITHLYAFLPKGDTYWMVMEYVPGKTLEEWLHYRGRMAAGLACSIVVQMLEGLQHAHRKGIIHRDLKPANVMISEEGEVKIMDFGIARIRDSQRITKHGKSVGTLAYMAPEQIKGDEGDERTDIYAAGNILYELLSGHMPFEADTDYHLMKLKLEEAPKPLDGLAAVTPPELQKVIFKALDRNPAKRFESVAALREAIERSMQGKLLKAEVLNPKLSDLQQEESFVQAVKAHPLRKFSGMMKSLPGRAAVSRISGSLRSFNAGRNSKAWWLLAASVVVCASLLFWFGSVDTPPQKATSEVAVPEDGISAPQSPAMQVTPRDSAPRKSQPPIIEQQIMQNNGTGSGSYSAPNESRRKESSGPEKGGDVPSKKNNGRSERGDDYVSGRDGRSTSAPEKTVTTAPRETSGPTSIPSGQQIQVVLDQTLSSEQPDLDGSQVRLHCSGDIVVAGRVVIRRGALVTGKIVDVRTSSNSRQGALIGFVIQQVQAVDGSMLKLRSDRFRNQADATGRPVYYRSGQTFSAETKGGRVK